MINGRRRSPLITCENMGDLLAPYVLGALDALDRRPVEDHVQACAPCAQLAREYQTIASSLAYGVSLAEPPPSLKERTMAQVAVMPQAARPPAPSPSRWQRLWEWLDVFFRPHAAAVALAGALGIAALAIWVGVLRTEISNERSATQAMARTLEQQQQTLAWATTPAVRKYAMDGTESAPTAWATMLYKPAYEEAMLVAGDMPTLPSTKVYQLWLVRDGVRTSGGTFTVDANGRGQVLVRAPLPITSYQSMGVTVEPMGGSPGPTGARVLRGPSQNNP